MFTALSFPGGGNRCYWQGGFWEAAAPALDLKPERVVGVSGGAFAASYSLTGIGEKVREIVIEACRQGQKDFDRRALLRGEHPFPVAKMYRELLDRLLDAEAFARLNEKTELQVMIARTPKGWPPSLAALTGLAAYQIEKKFITPVHRSFGRKLGFKAEYLSSRAMRGPHDWANAVYASACVPPIMPLGTIDGKPAVDGGMVDNAPTEPLEPFEKKGARTLVLLTRRYPKIPEVKNRLYVQPSQTPEVSQFSITNPDGIRAAYELGLRDGEKFAKEMRG